MKRNIKLNHYLRVKKDDDFIEGNMGKVMKIKYTNAYFYGKSLNNRSSLLIYYITELFILLIY